MLKYKDNDGLDQSSFNNAQMRNFFHEMADFIALYETLEEKFMARETAIEEKLLASETLLNKQLALIKGSLNDFQGIMTDAGAARWRIAAENALREGKSHLHALQQTTTGIVESIKDGCNQLEQTTQQTIAGMAATTKTLPIQNFKHVIEQGCIHLKATSNSAIQQISKLIRWLHWKNFTMTLIITLFVIFLAGLYESDKWPWEIHQQVANERNAGAVLLAAWPHLTPTEQQDIINDSKKVR